MRTTGRQRPVNPLSRYLGLLLMAAVLGACSNPEDDFRAAAQAGTTVAWREFIQQHPNSALAGQARLRLDDLLEQQDWAKAQAAQSAEALRAYLQAHPMGPNADAALEQLLDLERRYVWQTAERAASREAYENFLLQYPDAPEADAARERIAGLSPPIAAKAVQPAGAKAAAAGAPTTAAGTPATRPAKAAKTSAGNTRLQFGAFSTRERALQQRQSLESRFGKLLPGTLSVDAPGSNSRDQLYRLRSAPMSEAQARSTCTALKEQGQACMVVP
jgi:SPOR domain